MKFLRLLELETRLVLRTEVSHACDSGHYPAVLRCLAMPVRPHLRCGSILCRVPFRNHVDIALLYCCCGPSRQVPSRSLLTMPPNPCGSSIVDYAYGGQPLSTDSAVV